MIKAAHRKGFLGFLVAMTIAGGIARAQDAPTEKLPSTLNIAHLLAGPDHKDFKCDLELSPPLLTFQQRFLVRLRGDFDPGAEDRRKNLKLFFVAKVADAKGEWLPGETYRAFDVKAGFDKDSALEYMTGFYVQPGKYTVALIVYDAQSGKTDVIRKPFEVKKLKNDPLPELARNLAPVDFVEEAPTDAPPVRTRSRDFARRRLGLSNYHPEDAWAPGEGVAYLPVNNVRPLRVDIILNVAASVDRFQDEAPSESQYRSTAGSMLQAGAVLSNFGLTRGCVRISAIDLSKTESVFEPMSARGIDWQKFAKKIEKRDNDTISVKVLSRPSSIAEFLEEYLKKVADDRSGCSDESGPVDHAIIFVSQAFSFRTGKLEDVAQPSAERPVRYLLVRINRSGGGDDLARFFKALQAQRFDANSPEQFRAVLAQLVADLGGGGKDRK